MSPFDCLLLAHFLTQCDCSLKLLDLHYCGLTSHSLEIMYRVNLENFGTTQIEQVDLSYNMNIRAKLSLLSTLLMFEHTWVLKACGLQYSEGAPCAANLICLLNMRHLTTLTTLEISVKDIPIVEIATWYLSEKGQTLEKSNIFVSLQNLHIRMGTLTVRLLSTIFKSVQHNTSLEDCDLSENSRLVEGDSEAVGCAIERMLNVNRTIKILNLTDCGFTSEVASYFANGLTQNHSVRKVILHSNNIGSTRAVSIFRSLDHNTSLEEVDLSVNSQLVERDSEAVGCALEKMLNMKRTLKVLNLCGCKVTDPVAKHVVTGLMHQKYVTSGTWYRIIIQTK